MQAKFTAALRQNITDEEFAALESLSKKINYNISLIEKGGRSYD